MFKRVEFVEWAGLIGLIGFLLTFAGFCYLVNNALRMSKAKRDHLSQLPLEDDPEPKARND